MFRSSQPQQTQPPDILQCSGHLKPIRAGLPICYNVQDVLTLSDTVSECSSMFRSSEPYQTQTPDLLQRFGHLTLSDPAPDVFNEVSVILTLSDPIFRYLTMLRSSSFYQAQPSDAIQCACHPNPPRPSHQVFYNVSVISNPSDRTSECFTLPTLSIVLPKKGEILEEKITYIVIEWRTKPFPVRIRPQRMKVTPAVQDVQLLFATI